MKGYLVAAALGAISTVALASGAHAQAGRAGQCWVTTDARGFGYWEKCEPTRKSRRAAETAKQAPHAITVHPQQPSHQDPNLINTLTGFGAGNGSAGGGAAAGGGDAGGGGGGGGAAGGGGHGGPN